MINHFNATTFNVPVMHVIILISSWIVLDLGVNAIAIVKGSL